MINYLHVRSFCGISYAKVDLKSARVHLIKGPNASGKTSLADAIRYVLVGEPGRVALKGQLKYLVKEGEKTGQATVGVVVDGQPILATRIVPTGELITDPKDMRLDLPAALPFVLDAQRLAAMEPVKRRVFMRELMGVKANKEMIAKRLNQRECDTKRITEIMPLLRTSTGFEDAEKYAKNKASEARSSWKFLTGENYGSQKAESWAPTTEPVDEKLVEQKRQELFAAEQALETIHDRFKAAQMAAQALPCPHCGSLVRVNQIPNSSNYRLDPYQGDTASPDDIEALRTDLNKATHNKGFVESQLQNLESQRNRVEDASKVAEAAIQQHRSCQGWTKLAEAMGPNGIPGELLTEVLSPMNEHLRAAALETGWPQVEIRPDMSIWCGGRWYPLLSESERWRADAQLAEAVSSFADLSVLVLDRFDVLQPSLRTAGLSWLAGLQERYEVILLFATMESETVGLRGGVYFHQLTGGRLEG